MFSPSRLSLCGAILLGATGLHGAKAQPVSNTAPPTNPAQQGDFVRVEATTVEKELRLQVELQNGDIFEAIGQIANKGNLQVVVKTSDAALTRNLRLRSATPEAALQKVCEVAGLELSMQKEVWLVAARKRPVVDTEEPKITEPLLFTNTSIYEALTFIANQYDLPIAIGGDIATHFRFLRLQNKTPYQAVEAIALAADLKLQKTEDGVIIVSRQTEPPRPPLTGDIPMNFRKKTPTPQP